MTTEENIKTSKNGFFFRRESDAEATYESVSRNVRKGMAQGYEYERNSTVVENTK